MCVVQLATTGLIAQLEEPVAIPCIEDETGYTPSHVAHDSLFAVQYRTDIKEVQIMGVLPRTYTVLSSTVHSP